jgi:hypothetical protein
VAVIYCRPVNPLRNLPASVNTLERFRANSPFLRAAQALLCALFLLNLGAYFSHDHASKSGVSGERLICPHCSTFTAVIEPRAPVAVPARVAAFCTLLTLPEAQRFLPPLAIAQWARGPPISAPAMSMSFS